MEDLIRAARRAFEVLRVALRRIVLPAVLRPRDAEPPHVRVRRGLEDLGGAWVKLGQTLAMRLDLLPPEYCTEFFKLLNEVKPFPYADVRRIVQAELGMPPEQVFESFEREPFASASIGQVHRAVLPTGERVAVKVQRPHIRRIIETDIALMYLGGHFLDALRLLGGTPSHEVVGEFARWTELELDYRVEARSAQRLRSNAGDDPIERHPAVYADLSSERVLVTEIIEGILLIDVLSAVRSNDAAFLAAFAERGHRLDRIATHLLWNSLNQVYSAGCFHADLHPANLFVLPGDAIGYVDYGMVGELDADMRDSLVFYAWQLYEGSVERATDELLRWVSPSERTDVEAAPGTRPDRPRLPRRAEAAGSQCGTAGLG